MKIFILVIVTLLINYTHKHDHRMCCYRHFLDHLLAYDVFVRSMILRVKTFISDTKKNHLLTNDPFYL